MKAVEIAGIDEEELYAFIRALPNFWERGKWDSSLEHRLRRYHDSEAVSFGVNIFSTSNASIILFAEYYRETRTAIIEIHSYHLGEFSHPEIEQKMRDIFLKSPEADFAKLKAIPHGNFVCPLCNAKYALRSIKAREDGRLECQNCGRLVDFKKDDQEDLKDYI